ncbi:MAG: eukaryotic-like serine/threonine-protein kinase, partial [Thermoleophilaceae bacterium]|nr:eukaryotic-like serine/threonine-protein kinase [Thermoleophilaceae bacterium]
MAAGEHAAPGDAVAESGGDQEAQPGDRGLLGREQELAELALGLAEALRGRGQFFVLAGESGIGKTCLADAIAARAELEGAAVRWGRAWEDGGAPAFWPWVQIIRGLTQDREPDLLRRQLGAGAQWVAQIVPELRTVMPDLEPPGALDTDQARFALFDAVATFLGAAAAEQPLMIALDDIHAADPPTLLMLDFVARSVRDAPVFLLASYQEVAAHARPDIGDIVGDLAREARRIALRRLSEADVASMIRRAGTVDPAPELVRSLHATTDGNPFFANEVVRLLAAEGQLEHAGGATASFPLPDTVRDAVRRRFQPLGTTAVETLEMAAVIGREFRLGTLERVAGVPRDELIETLDRAVTVDLIEEQSGTPGLFRFDHGLMRQTLYEELEPIRRVHAHGTVGDTLEELYAAETEPHVAELAHHYLAAAAVGYAEKAVDYAARAGERAMRLLAYEEAARLFDGALGSLELAQPDPPRRAGLLLSLGRAQVRAGDGAARKSLGAAATAARSLERPELLAEAALAFRAFARVPGVVDEEVVALLEEALELLGPEDSAVRARLLVRMAVQLYDRMDAGPQRQAFVDDAIAMARRLGDAGTLAYVLHNAQLALWGPDTREQALEWSEEVIPLAGQAGDLELVLVTHSRQADLLLELDDLPGADVEIEALDRRVRESLEPRARAHLALQRSRRAAMEGRFDDAERLTAEAAALGARAGDTTIRVITMGQEWAHHWSQGRLSELEAQTRQFADALPGMPVWRAALAAVYCDQAREAEARREL